jgi:hypothetical protein
MTNEGLEAYLRGLGWTVEHLTGADGHPYLVIRNYEIPAGSLAGRSCDVAIWRTPAVPYVAPPAVHTRPVLVPIGQHNTSNSGIGPGWQYWSRLLRIQPPTPRDWVTHIATIFSEV